MAPRNTPASPKPDKLMREALALELHREDVVDGQPEKRLRRVARALVTEAMDGNVPAIKEICDRMDGKVPQGIMSDESGPLIVELMSFHADGPPTVRKTLQIGGTAPPDKT